MLVIFRIGHLNEGTYAYKFVLKDIINKLVNAKERREGREKCGKKKKKVG